MQFSPLIPFTFCFLLIAQVASVYSVANDPMLSQQWWYFHVGADKAYDTGFQGQGVTVAVLDTGVDRNHPDLKDNIVDGWNFVDNNDDVTDKDGHGTHVAGIIAAVANNGIGIAGIAPKAKIMPIKVLTRMGGTPVDIQNGVQFAVQKGARIISMSLGGYSSSIFQTIMSTAITSAYFSGAVIIAAAGNENTDRDSYPAAYKDVIAVSAIDQSNQKASFSNYGKYIALAAPGVNILSTYPGGTYRVLQGTSMATPIVSGVAALLLSKYPNLSPDGVKETLFREATDLGPPGWDPVYGHGLVNARAAVTERPVEIGRPAGTTEQQQQMPLRSSSLIISFNEKTIVAGSSLTITGSVTPAKSVDVTIEYSADEGASWKTFGMTKSSAEGRYSHFGSIEKVGLYLFKASWKGDAELQPASSELVWIKVQERPFLESIPGGAITLVAVAGTLVMVLGVAILKRRKIVRPKIVL